MRLPFHFAKNTTLLLLSLVLAFHLLVVLRVIPYTIVWGGKLENLQQMLVFESVSILVNLGLLLVIVQKGKQVKAGTSSKIIIILLWTFTLLFSLNTIGNLFAEKSLETIVFTPVTFILAILCGRMAIEKPATGLTR